MKQQSKLSRDMAIALLLAGLFLLILALVSLDSTDSYYISDGGSGSGGGSIGGSDSGSGIKGNTSAKPIEIINKHLRDVYDRQEIEKKNAENLNIITAPPIYKSPKDEPVYNFDNLPITFDQDSINELIGKDLGQLVEHNSSDRSLSEQIQDEVVNDITLREQKEAEKRSLAEAIINKAREKGLHVEIDDDFKVKSVKKIIKKENPSIFDPNAVPNR